jgi:hypothetical protein
MTPETTYEYDVRTMKKPPTAVELGDLARHGWRLVSVTLGNGTNGGGNYLAYLERPVSADAQPRARKGFPRLLSGARWRRQKGA